MFAAGQASYMKKQGWEVFVCYAGANDGVCAIPSLNEYVSVGGGWQFFMQPPYKFQRQEQELFIKFMIERLGLYDYENCEIVIESHFDIAAYWAEILAAAVRGRHIFASCNETYRNFPGRFYEDNLDFFYFKLKRNEITGHDVNIPALFNGYKGVTGFFSDVPDLIRSQDAVQDVEDFPIDEIQKADWNICHIGRSIKPFVVYAIVGVAELARRHPDKTINFLFVGQLIPEREQLIKQIFAGVDNVTITPLGDTVPIPRSLFSKIDVVCAMAGAAFFSAFENVPVIVGNVDVPEKTSGVLGYDTEETQHPDKNLFDYVNVLEDVLVNKTYEEKTFSLEKPEPADKVYEKIFTLLENADPNKEYFTQRLLTPRLRDWTAIFPFGNVERGTRIILAGATEIAKDYKKQNEIQGKTKAVFGRDYIKNIPEPAPSYCEVVATVDEHPEEFDDSVEGLDRLTKRDYDVILISAYPENSQSVIAKIFQIVPDMAKRVIYNFQKLQT